MTELKDDLRQMLTSVCGLSNGFAADADLYRDLAVPSFKSVDLLMALEDRYKVSIPDEQYLDATSLDRLTEMMQELLPK
jgi:acyl carrier protein